LTGNLKGIGFSPIVLSIIAGRGGGVKPDFSGRRFSWFCPKGIMIGTQAKRLLFAIVSASFLVE